MIARALATALTAAKVAKIEEADGQECSEGSVEVIVQLHGNNEAIVDVDVIASKIWRPGRSWRQLETADIYRRPGRELS